MVIREKANSENESTLEPTTKPVQSQEPVLSDEPVVTSTPEPVISEEPIVTPTFNSEEPVPSSGTDIPDEYKESVLCPILIYQGKTDKEMDINADYDRDGLSNLSEYENGTDPGIADSDGDGFADYKEIYTYNTDPLVYDTDKDGLGDGTEIANAMNPLEKDTNGDGVLDGDGISDDKDPQPKDYDKNFIDVRFP